MGPPGQDAQQAGGERAIGVRACQPAATALLARGMGEMDGDDEQPAGGKPAVEFARVLSASVTVTSTGDLDPAEVRTALEAAGYEPTGP